jgi:HlyD family secretion protein
MLKKIKNNKFIGKILSFATTHKIISTIIVVLVLFSGNYFWKQAHPVADTSYVLGTVQKGTVVVSVSGTGQISTENQTDLKANASGNIVSLPVTAGQVVKQGDLIAALDSRDALIALQTAQVALNKLLEPADTLSVTQDQSSLSQSYNDGFNNVATSFVDLPVIMQGLYDLLYKQGGYLTDQYVDHQSFDVQNLRMQANNSFGVARTALDTLTAEYNTTSKSSSSSAQIETLIEDAYTTSKDVSQAVKDAKNTVDALQVERNEQTAAIATSAESSLSTWTSQINSDLGNILNSKNSIANNKQSLYKLQGGADPLDIQSAKLAVEQKQNAYNDCFVRAPFDGVIARVSAHLLDSVSGGTVIATIVTPQQFADISLNEVDIVKVKQGQKATMTFDAINGLTVTGVVAEVDSVGTNTQGVVNYNVKIKLDSNNDSVRPGMTVSASIVTDVHTDVLTVPNSAIKTTGGGAQVQVVTGADKNLPQTSSGVAITQPLQIAQVQIGLQNDSETEITSGLNEGDVIVLRTISGSTAKTSTSATSFSLPGAGGNRGVGGGGGGARGAVRIGG